MEASVENIYEITLDNLIKVLNKVLDSKLIITSDTEFMFICSNDMNRVLLINNAIKEYFDVQINFSDIISVNTINDLLEVILQRKTQPAIGYLVTARDARRNDLFDIVKQGKLDELDNSLKEAKDTLEEQLKSIKGCVVPTNELGHKTKYETINNFLNRIDTKVSRNEIVKVVEAVDGNIKTGFDGISKAIQATNTCIDAIGKLMLMIIHIENDLYNIADETTEGVSAISKELLEEGFNIEGLARIAEREVERRRNIQKQQQQFKADIYGKIKFLNRANQNLMNESSFFQEEIKRALENEFNSLRQQRDLLQEQYSYLESKLSEKYNQALVKLDTNANHTKEELGKQINLALDEQNRLLSTIKNEMNEVALKHTNEIKAIKWRNKITIGIIILISIIEIYKIIF